MGKADTLTTKQLSNRELESVRKSRPHGSVQQLSLVIYFRDGVRVVLAPASYE